MATPAENSRRLEPSSTAKSKPKKNLNFCGEPSFVTFIVGKEAQKFTVHKNLAEHYSPFFEKAFNSGFVEGQTQEMVLDDVEAGIFGYVVNWLYTQKIIHPEESKIQLEEMAKLWVLAGRFLIPRLQNEAIRHMDWKKHGELTKIMGNLESYVMFALSREFEGTQLYRKVLDDLLMICIIVAKSPDPSELSEWDNKWEIFLTALTNAGGETAVAIIKGLVVRCAPFLSKMQLVKPIEQYFVEEGDAADGN
ncbi:Kelch repeat and BTB domain-containing protein 8 [Lachnellula arida]|uniref:Kelch repeat and BTB domain-containing protein 8 n=1 Tax=Lachnellula arida TaxID=1316785 RepID=A0A8T9B3Z2_9HELO|nr:Kelch repeat and BTB domain-containing protein 8 [Lachnellula arida]